MTAHWGVPDPSAATGTEAEQRFAFADTIRMMRQRISIFINLPVAAGHQTVPSFRDRVDILPNPDIGPFAKDDGEVVIDANGRRVR